jgi:D-glycero-alpha-D-manno-heptose-7-phosphate kinase
MLIAKAPLRISIGGGGTDLPSYYSKFGSSFISAAINKYVYISLHKNFRNEFLLRYSETEKTQNIQDIKHPLIRECLLQAKPSGHLEISSFADIPAGTGLGSSGTFTVALLKALYSYQSISHTALSLAEDACRIEMEKLQSPVGKQDQYIASFGGITQFAIDTDGSVTARPLAMSESSIFELQDSLLMYFTGFYRSSSMVLSEQKEKSDEKQMLENLHFVKDLGHQIGAALEKGQIDEFGNLMHTHWEFKKKRSSKTSNQDIDSYYDLARKNGALGGKLIGAGGGGFLLFATENKRKLRQALKQTPLQEVPFSFDFLGAQIMMRER